MTKIIITGARGRMGQALVACAPQHPELSVVDQIDQGDDLAAVIAKCDVVVDFSSHTATAEIVALCAKHGKALVIGTTGHDDAARARILPQAARISLVWSSNYSTGVNTLFWLTRKAAEILGPGYDLEVLEMHHRLKKMRRVARRSRWPRFWPTCASNSSPQSPGMDAPGLWARAPRKRSGFIRFAVATWSATTRSSSPRTVSAWS